MALAWALLVSPGLSRVLLGCPVFPFSPVLFWPPRASMRSPGLLCTPPCRSWPLLRLTGFFCALLGSSCALLGSFWARLGSSVPSFALLSSPVFSCARCLGSSGMSCGLLGSRVLTCISSPVVPFALLSLLACSWFELGAFWRLLCRQPPLICK